MMDFSAVNVQNTRLDCFHKMVSSYKKNLLCKKVE